MISTLSELLALLQNANSPADVFGPLASDQLSGLKRRYRELIVIAHPDRNSSRANEANAACIALQQWFAEAQQQLAHGSYGSTPRISVASKLHQYVGYKAPLQGDLCELFPTDSAGTAVLLKVARHARNNDLLHNEAQTLRKLDHVLEGQVTRAHFPTLIEHFLLSDGAGAQRHTNVLRNEIGYVSLADVIHVYPNGLPAADAAWMFNRMLTVLGIIHSQGIVHGAVTPAHVLIRPEDHNGMLIDWCYSVPIGETIKAISPPYKAHYPPEVPARQAATPATDLFMAARCLIQLLGGNTASGELPPHVPKAISALLRACTLPAPQRRSNDAWQVFDDFHEILGQLYGPPQFRPFHMPQAATVS